MHIKKLSISLPADMVQGIRRQVTEGGYASVSEVIREAVRLWQDRAREREGAFRQSHQKTGQVSE